MENKDFLGQKFSSLLDTRRVALRLIISSFHLEYQMLPQQLEDKDERIDVAE